MVGVDVGVVSFLRLRVEVGEVVIRADAPGGAHCGVAAGRGRREAFFEGCAWRGSLSLGVLVHFHAGGTCGGPSLVVVWLLGSPPAGGWGSWCW